MKEHTRQEINKQTSGITKMSPVSAELMGWSPKWPFNDSVFFYVVICLDYLKNLAKPDELVQPRKMVQSTGISDNNFLQYTGHGTNVGHQGNTDHHMSF